MIKLTEVEIKYVPPKGIPLFDSKSEYKFKFTLPESREYREGAIEVSLRVPFGEEPRNYIDKAEEIAQGVMLQRSFIKPKKYRLRDIFWVKA